MNWALVVSCVLALPLVCLFPENYKRTNIDTVLSIDVDVSIDVKINSDDKNHDSHENTVEGNDYHGDQENTEKSYSPYDL